MTDAATDNETGGLRAETLISIIAGIALLAAIWFLVSQRQQALRWSPAGFEGLQVWLSSEEVSAQSFTGGWLIDPASVGMLVIPIYDTALDRDRDYPETKEDLLLQQDEYDIASDAILEKASRVPTLIVLPKWRTGMRLTGLGHPVLLVDPKGPDAILRMLTGDPNARLAYGTTPFTDFAVTGDTTKTARIYAAQMMQAKGCLPVIGRQNTMILADCPLAKGKREDRVLILSDPDVLNNHGLRLGQNAVIARDVLSERADGKNILIDYSRSSWLADPEAAITRERTWSDLMRFFEPPFQALWFGSALLLALALWRASLRYGPVIRGAYRGDGASKAHAIEARARLMRLSNQDGALLGEYAKARIGAVAASLFGPSYVQHYSNKDAFVGYVARRHPDQARDLDAVLSRIADLSPRLSAEEAIRHVDDLERILERIANDT